MSGGELLGVMPGTLGNLDINLGWRVGDENYRVGGWSFTG